jgi:putative DNA primase/helicase
MSPTFAHCADADALAEAFAALCNSPQPTADGWEACCPSHHDITPSLSITPHHDRILIYCHAGCDASSIVAALSLTFADLFLHHTTNGAKCIVHVYDYTDVSGTVLHQTVRYLPKAFKQRRPHPARPGEYIWSLKGIEPVLFHLPEVMAAISRGDTIVLCEGEKDAECVTTLGFTSSTNAMGAKKWRKSYTDTLRDAHVVLLADHDSAGLEHIQKVAAALYGTAASVKLVIECHTAAPKSDVSDWVDAGHTRIDFETLVAQTAFWTPPPPPAVGPGPQPGTGAASEPPLPYSDVTNGYAFVRDHGADVRFCHPWGKWMVWTNTHWDYDQHGTVLAHAKKTIKRLARQVEYMDNDQALALMAHIKTSLSAGKLKAMVECAESEEGVPILPKELDAHPWLLCVANGTIDLRGGALRPHDRMDYLTACLSVHYDKDATCPKWNAFLSRVMAGNTSLIRWLQKAVGYALTGVIREHILIILWGTGRNGKSTFLNTILALLEAYGMKATSELLMVSTHDRHPTERADLFGKRFVTTIETEQGRRLAEVFVKEATGGDPIRARRMREDFWEFKPTHKFFLGTNHKPVVRGTDTAIWARLKLVPFVVTIPEKEQDKTLPDQLTLELPGILNWALEGCLIWQKEGLGEPDEIRQATAGYRAEMDVIGQFIDDCCDTGPHKREAASVLYEAYKRWCDQTGEHVLIQRAWGMALAERGFEGSKAKGRSWWNGLALKKQGNTPFPEGNKVDDGGPWVDEEDFPPQGVGAPDVRGETGGAWVDEEPGDGLPTQPTDTKGVADEKGPWVDEGRPENGYEQEVAPTREAYAVSSSTSSTSSTPPISTKEDAEIIANTTCDDFDGCAEGLSYTYITTETQLKNALFRLEKSQLFAVDTETTGFDWWKGEAIRLVSIATAAQTVVIDALTCPLDLLHPLLLGEGEFIFHNAKFDLVMLAAAGLPWPARVCDTLVLAKLLTARGGKYQPDCDLGSLVERELGQILDKSHQKDDWAVPDLRPDQLHYAAMDAAVLLPLRDALLPRIAAAGLGRINKIEQALVPATAWMEMAGMPLEAEPWQALAREGNAGKLVIEEQLHGLVETSGYVKPIPYTKTGKIPKSFDPRVNWNSPDQVVAVLQARGHDVTSIALDGLKMLGTDDPVVALFIDRNPWKVQEQRGLWITKHWKDGRLYANFNQMGSSAGRYSCSRPNLQNVPRPKAYRRCFRAPEGRCIIKADYGQIELRIAGVLAKEQEVIRAFERGEDLHKRTAAKVLGIDPSEVTEDQRQVAKTVNFGLIYGLGPESLRVKVKDELDKDLSLDEAQAFCTTFFELYPKFDTWHTRLDRDIQKRGAIETRTKFGRRRLNITSYRDAANSPCQGSAADGLKLALVRLWRDRDAVPGVRVVGTVHDEIILEAPLEQVDAASRWVEQHMREAMERVVENQVRIVVGVTEGRDWAGTSLTDEEASA